MRVVVAEEIASAGLERLREAGHDVDEASGTDRAGLLRRLPGASALIVRSATSVDAELLAAADRLVVVARAGVGVDNVDVAAATERGVLVVNAPESNVLSAAEHTIGLLLALARNVARADQSLRAGRWERSRWTGVELAGKTLGILGLGRIGSLVATRTRALQMNVLAYDPYLSPERAATVGVELVSFDEVLLRSDFLSVHMPRTPETIGLIGADALARAKPGIRIVNVARGGIVDEVALDRALRDGRVAGAALDVFTTEPLVDSPLVELDNVVLTPHLGASTYEAQERAAESAADMVCLALAGEFVPFAVNLSSGAAAEAQKPFLGLAERLGGVFASRFERPPARLVVETGGEIAAYDPAPLAVAALTGALRRWTTGRVSEVNAIQRAAELGLTLESRAGGRGGHRDYVNLVSVRSGAREMSATLAGRRREARIVAIDGHLTDIPPAPHMLVVANDDRPGAIGRVATALGDAGINIANMDVGATERAGSALMCIATDSPVPPDLIERLRTMEGIVAVEPLSS